MQPQHPQLSQAFALARAGRLAEALAGVTRVAEAGDPEGLFALADIYWHGGLTDRDPARALDLFGQSAVRGHPIAAMTYTNLLANGGAGPRDWSAALERLRAEAAMGPRRAATLALVDAMDLTAEGDPAALPAAERLSDAPEITRYPALFTADECDYLIRIAEPGLRPSMVTDGRGGVVQDPIRTSDGFAAPPLMEDPAIHALNRRLAAASGSRAEQGEPLQVLRYAGGQQYRRHVDWLSEDGNTRILTALVYLNDGYKGGETDFPRIGVRVAGRRGDALVFRNGTPEALDRATEHAGLPVTRGAKFLASRWIRERSMIV